MTYRVLYIDPPWTFKTYSKRGQDRSPENHYPTMTNDDIENLNLQALMAEDCAVFMWATWPLMDVALQVGASWGLSYKTCAFLWAKTNPKAVARLSVVTDRANWRIGLGYWTRANSEACLLFTKGKPTRKAKDVRQLVIAPFTVHSRKPAEVYEYIERLVDGPYCEIFARSTRPGWASIGNEIDGRDVRDVIGTRD